MLIVTQVRCGELRVLRSSPGTGCPQPRAAAGPLGSACRGLGRQRGSCLILLDATQAVNAVSAAPTQCSSGYVWNMLSKGWLVHDSETAMRFRTGAFAAKAEQRRARLEGLHAASFICRHCLVACYSHPLLGSPTCSAHLSPATPPALRGRRPVPTARRDGIVQTY